MPRKEGRLLDQITHWKHRPLFSEKGKMVSSASVPKTSYHERSNSLPSRPHPVIPQISDHLCSLRASEASSSSSISHHIVSLQDLHECVDKLLLLPLTQQSLGQQQHEKWVNELLDGSLQLFDLCNTAKDALVQTKECTQELQSSMRRRLRGDGLASEVRKYLTSRKSVKKAVGKVLGNLKGMKNKCTTSPPSADNETVALFSILREVETVTVTFFESFLSFMSGPKSRSKPARWSLVSKLVNSKRVACEEEETDTNEFTKLDAVIHSVCLKKQFDDKDVENLQNQLENLEMCRQDFEDGLECLFRRLIKTRVSLLNILNH